MKKLIIIYIKKDLPDHVTNQGQLRRKCSRDSTLFTQLKSGFMVSWKQCLNLYSLKWLKPSLNLVIKEIPLGLWQL